MADWIEAARSACLMQGMADHLGVDLETAVATGRLSATEHDEMVARCRSCAKPDACILWMVERQSAEEAPGYCLNGERLGTLR